MAMASDTRDWCFDVATMVWPLASMNTSGLGEVFAAPVSVTARYVWVVRQRTIGAGAQRYHTCSAAQ